MPAAKSKVQHPAPYAQVLTDPAYKKKLDKLAYMTGSGGIFLKLLEKGSDQQLLTFLEHHISGDIQSWPDNMARKALRARANKHIKEIDGYWSNLADLLVSRFYVNPRTELIIKTWGDWAKTLNNPASFDADVAAVLNIKAWRGGPLEAVAANVPMATDKFVDSILEMDFYTPAVGVFLDRTDLPASTMRARLQKEFAGWGGNQAGATYRTSQGELLRRLVARPQWHEPGFADRLLEEARKMIQEYKPTFKAQPIVRVDGPQAAAEMLAAWPGREPEFWERAIELLKHDHKLLAKTMSNPNFPKAIARKYLKQGASTEVRVAIARNKKWIQDKAMRALLEQSGQNSQVWWYLLDTTTDPVEAGRLFSYLATKDLARASGFMMQKGLPEGTVVPSTIMSQIIVTQKEREQRVAIIKALPGIKPDAAPAPQLPNRAKHAKRDR